MMDTTLNLRGTDQHAFNATTTLYDLISALHTVMPPNDDEQVVATVAHWLESGWLAWFIDSQPDALSAAHRN